MKTTLTVALTLAGLLALAGVAGYAFVAHGMSPSGASAAGGGVGTLDVFVQDSPTVNWSHVYVTFDQIAVHPADGNASNWQTVNLTQKTVDLESLKTVSTLVGSATLKAGTYTQLRIVVKSAEGVMANGTTVNFTVPSGELKTADAFNVTTGQSTSLTIDIDLSRSIVDANGTWIFTPVLGSVESN